MSWRSTSSALRRSENIADAPHAADLDIAAKLGQLLAEPGYLRFECVGLDLVVETVNRLDQGLARDNAVPAHQQRFEDQGFAAAKQDLGVGHGGLVGADMQFDVAEREDRRGKHARPPRDPPGPRAEHPRAPTGPLVPWR